LLAPVVAGDPNAEVRLEALEIVAESESDEAVAVVRTALNDPDDDVRTEAEDLLDEWAEEMF
jgi:HEAT repeat protein